MSVLVAHAEAHEHPRQALRSTAVLVDGLPDLRLGHQERGREGIGQPLLIGSGPQVPVDVDRRPIAVEDVSQLVGKSEQSPRSELVGVDKDEQELRIGDR